MSDTRPRRSVLYAPGDKARALEKMRQLDVDAVIIDLEDSVAPEMKALARERACAAVAAGGFGFREVAIRLNARSTAHFADDLAAVGAAGPDVIVLSKVETPEDVIDAERRLDANGAGTGLRLWAMIETPLGLLNLRDIAERSRAGSRLRLAGIVLGTNDIAKDTGVQPGEDRAPLVPWLLQAVLVARAYGLLVFDGVYNAFSDLPGFERECAQGRQLGFDGKTLIHPSQIEAANRVFAPDADAVRQAQAIIAAFAQPENRDKGAINLEGQMVERLHAETAARLIETEAAIRQRTADAAGSPPTDGPGR
ncbi:CoA ester lyase [Ancylobacter sp. TS-1]|uniref:HpcH/HpaI aldolase/citrate lyase family protein n=1 Tax=Ancylobacter sp. TS-1 TaxID=1850374 RepID=UPI001265BED3|nr:CoA ester lyase [Ancylobacter sp. TS-1]QFR34911.1 CoA ester lyase [Ancylobacter sp. TS-1]